MPEVTYGASVFHAILRGLQDEDERLAKREFEVRDDGVRLKPFRPDRPWHPWNEMLERGSPDPDETPLLPIPFNARELAAFLMDGSGKHLVGMDFGDWVTGPEDWERSCTVLSAKAKEAMLDAYAAFRAAADSADHLLPAHVRELAAQYADAKAAVRRMEVEQGVDCATSECSQLRERERQLEEAHSRAHSDDLDAERRWRKAIVRRLLGADPKADSVPDSTHDRSPNQPKVRWRQALIELLPQITAEKKKTDVDTVIRELRKRGRAWGIQEDATPGCSDGLRWKDREGTSHDLQRKTISNALSDAKVVLKKQGKPPS